MKDRKYRIKNIDRTGGEEMTQEETYTTLRDYLHRMKELMRDEGRHTAERTSSKVYHLPQETGLFE